MRTRAERLAYDHVGALNLIELEFYGNEKVLEAHKAYLNHLRDKAPDDNDDTNRFFDRRNSLYHDLLFRLGKAVGLAYDKAELQENTYSPMGWANDQNVQRMNGQLLNEVLSGRRRVPLTVELEK